MMPGNPSNYSPEQLRAVELISALCDERLAREQADELERLVCEHVPVRKLYVSMMHLHAGLHHYASALGNLTLADAAAAIRPEESITDEPASSGMGETMVMPAMREPLEEEDENHTESFPPPSYPAAPVAKRSPYLKGGLAALLVLGLGLLIYFLIPPRVQNIAKLPEKSPEPPRPPVGPVVPPVPAVATISLKANAIWAPGNPPPADGNFTAGQHFALMSGAVQLQLKSGGQLVVEGPAELDFRSATELSLHQGRVVATVPGGGLVVQCPTGKVTDLGTEFGMSVAADGGTEVAVFKGKVAASLSNTAASNNDASNNDAPNNHAATQPVMDMVLTVGQAAVISQKAVSLSPEGAIPQRYICNLKNQGISILDVTDLVCGGDGTSRKRGLAIDQLTGVISTPAPAAMRTGDRTYHRVIGYPVVDGAFVPDGTNGPMAVDSANDQFTFEHTTNQTYNYIWTGGKIPWTDQQGISTLMDGVDYSGDDHSIICTHSNNAITLDLNAIRRMYPDRQLATFRCRFANSYVNGWFGAAKVNPVASAIVLIDGKNRFEKLHFTNQDGGTSINLPLGKTDRFLTLVCTDAGTEIDHDWILWGDPKIELLPADPSPEK